MTRHLTLHPAWCGQTHVCSVDRPGGEHRSHPLTLDATHARLVATRIRTRAGRDRIEFRAVINLPADPARAQAMARLLVVRLHHTIAATHRSGGTR